MTDYTLDDYLYRMDLELEYSAVFVPFSKSRNAKAEIKYLSDYSINWRVTIKSPSGSIESDYMEGIGYLPKVVTDDIKGMRDTIYNHDVVKHACEIGKSGYSKAEKFPPPDLKDVLYCLLLDGEAIDYTFEEWCSNFGYDEDSRKAESIYKECISIGLRLRKVLGETHMNKLRELYQDY